MKRGVLLVGVLCAAILVYAQVQQKRGQTSRVSVSSSGAQANDLSRSPTISASGRYVAFSSDAHNLVDGDTIYQHSVFLHDRQTGQTSLISVSSSGVQGNGASYNSSITADGRYVAFHSYATNLVPGDTNGVADAFVHDRQTGQTTRVSVSSTGEQGDLNSLSPSISADGRYVAYSSWSSNLVEGESNDRMDVFVYDRQTGRPSRISVSSGGEPGNGNSEMPSISADGRFVAFHSIASNLVEGDTNDKYDEFVHDRQTGQTTRASVSSNGEQRSVV